MIYVATDVMHMKIIYKIRNFNENYLYFTM